MPIFCICSLVKNVMNFNLFSSSIKLMSDNYNIYYVSNINQKNFKGYLKNKIQPVTLFTNETHNKEYPIIDEISILEATTNLLKFKSSLIKLHGMIDFTSEKDFMLC